MKKGFTLTLSMVIILIFMTTILTVETQKVSIEEQTHAQHAKLRAINSILLDLNSTAFDYSISRMGKRAMFDVIEKEISEKYVINAKDAICYRFLTNLDSYLTMSLGTRLEDTGLSISYTINDCKIELINATTVNLTTSVDLIFKEENKIEIRKSISKNTNFSIEGLPDPMLAIESYKDKDNTLGPIIRPIILSPLYNNSDNWEGDDDEFDELKIKSTNLLYGVGWVYGELINYNKNNINDEKYQKSVRGKILLIQSSNIKNQVELKQALEFASSNGSKAIAFDKSVSPTSREVIGASINPGCNINYTVNELQENEPCIKCGKFSVIQKSSIKTAGSCPAFNSCGDFASLGLGLCEKEGNTFYFYSPSPSDLNYDVYAVGSFKSGNYLIDSGDETDFPLLEKAKLYDIELQRSAILCGNYFLSDDAPDIFSRMEGDIGANDKYGIETFILGTWVLDSDKSKLDHEYYNGKNGVHVKGTTGCRDANMCDPDTEIFTIGRFAINDKKLDKYGMERIKYD